MFSMDLGDIVATHCCICSASLTDAVSIQRGIGPVCSRKYYEVEHDITKEMVMKALGRLFASALEPGVKLAAKSLKDRPRDLCNLIVKWASAHYSDPRIVLDVAGIVGALGFDMLAQVLRERRTSVTIVQDPSDPDRLTIHTAGSVPLKNHLNRVPGSAKTAKRGRFTLNYSFPKIHLDLVMTCLGNGFGGRWATVLDNVVRIPQKYWKDVQTARETARLAAYGTGLPPTVVATIPTVVPPTHEPMLVHKQVIEVRAPKFNRAFIEELKKLPRSDRRWNPDANCWEVFVGHEKVVQDLLARHFGIVVAPTAVP